MNRKPSIAGFVLATLLLGLQSCHGPSKSGEGFNLPPWLKGAIHHYRARVVEQCLYKGKPVYHLIRGDIPNDAGNEHRVYSGNGTFICSFGGFEGRLAEGSCDIEQVTYVRTIYEVDR
jgi:hypothetical protein